MKENIHPQYGKCIVRCVCGETFETGSTKKEMKVDICSKCHPFYTGKQKLVDTGGRVDRFKKRFTMEYKDEGRTAVRPSLFMPKNMLAGKAERKYNTI